MRKVTFDIETTGPVGPDGIMVMDISVVCIHDSETNEYSCYEENEFDKLWSIIEKADILIGYNSDHFDIPILNKYYPGDLTHIKSLDILKEIRKSLGRRLKLDNVAAATLGTGKSGNGLQAVTWWKNGEKQKVKDYCIQDVKVTKEVYEYALENRKLKYKDIGVKEIEIDTSKWEEKEDSSMTHTLPF